MSAISINNLTKTFRSHSGHILALDEVTFEVKTGSITGFLGPNGAGKSTTMNILLGFINKDSGVAQILGHPVGPGYPAARSDIGFLSNNFSLDKSFTVGQELEFLGRLSGKYDQEYSKRLAARLGVGWNEKIGNLSTGNYQKVAIASAIQTKPKLLILDEPTNGLDPLVQAEFNKIIRELSSTGSTIFISSHILSEVSELCDEFIFIKKGRVAAHMTKQEIDSQSGQVLTIKPNSKNRALILNFLNDNDIDYSVETGDLEQTFMEFYDQDLTASGKEK